MYGTVQTKYPVPVRCPTPTSISLQAAHLCPLPRPDKIKTKESRPPPPPQPPTPLPFHSAPFIPLLEIPLRFFTLSNSLSRLWAQPPNIGGGEEVQDRLTASLIDEEVPDLESALTSVLLPPYLCPQGPLLGLPVRAVL